MKLQLPPKLALHEISSRDPSHTPFLTSLPPEGDATVTNYGKGTARTPIKSRQPASVPEPQDRQYEPDVAGKSRIAYFFENSMKHALDFDSPRTKDAAAQLGVTFEDCLKK